jgi:hypothetical protein
VSRYSALGRCPGCEAEFRYFLIDTATNASAYAYCEACGATALVAAPDAEPGAPFPESREDELGDCACGGRFRTRSVPRCPECREPLEAEAARTWLEANDRRDGWVFPGSWHDVYAIVIENRLDPDALRGGKR